jgi:hypothetical protein
MSALPGRRPDLDQLRRQARELLRAAAAGDEEALRRILAVSQKQTLSAAQLAIARAYGFASWPKLRAEVLRRHGAEPDTGTTVDAGTLAPKSWQEMRAWCARLLESRTGQDVLAWNERIAAAAPQNRAGEPSLRQWLSAQGVTGHAQALLVWETFGYPGFLVADAEELIDKQYADRPQLRPVFDTVLATLPALPGPVTVQARGTLVSLVSPRRTFAVLKPTTKSRIDLGLRLDTTQPEGRLEPAKDLGQATVRIPWPLPATSTTRSGTGWHERTTRTRPRQPTSRNARLPGPSPSSARSMSSSREPNSPASAANPNPTAPFIATSTSPYPPNPRESPKASPG